MSENSAPITPSSETEEQRDIRVNKDIAAFSYVWIMSVIVFVARKDSRFIQYHSRQGIVLFLLTIPAAFIPIVGNFLILLLAAGMILGFIHAAQGKYEDVPVAGDLAKGKLKLADILHSVAKLLEDIASFLKRLFSKSEVTHQESKPPTTESDSSVDTPPQTPVL